MACYRAIGLVLFLALLSLPGRAIASSPILAETAGELAVGLNAEPDSLDPHRATNMAAATILPTLFDSLVWRDASGSFQPGLAESWEVSAGGTAYTFHLRDGVTFHDGTPFDAHAVQVNFDRIAQPAQHTGQAAALLGPYRETDIVDRLTARVIFDQPYLAFLDAASQPFLGMVSPASVVENGKYAPPTTVGTGFMMLQEWVASDHVSLQRNDDYDWGSPAFASQGPASYERLIFRFYPEESLRLAAFRDGAVDILDQFQSRDLAVLEDGRPYHLLHATAPGMPISLVLNLDTSPTDDLLVRQALNSALDRDQIVSFAFRGGSQPAHGPLAPATPLAADLNQSYPFDPDQAGALLDRAGWTMQESGIREKNGEQLILRWAIGPWDAQWAELAQAQFSNLGIVVQIVQLDESDLAAAFSAGNVNMVATARPGSDPSILASLLQPSASPSDMASIVTSAPAVAALLAEAAKASNEKTRAEKYTQAQRLTMDDALIVPVALVPENVVVAANLDGVRRDFRNGLWLHDVDDAVTNPHTLKLPSD